MKRKLTNNDGNGKRQTAEQLRSKLKDESERGKKQESKQPTNKKRMQQLSQSFHCLLLNDEKSVIDLMKEFNANEVHNEEEKSSSEEDEGDRDHSTMNVEENGKEKKVRLF